MPDDTSINEIQVGNSWYFDEMVGNAVHHDEFG
jgi:hypothetical protein